MENSEGGLASSARSRAAARGAFIGFLIDNFDIYLPVVALAPALTYFIPSTMNPATKALVSSWIFAATLVGRPVGALIFGTFADAIGRRRSTLIAVSGFCVGTALIAVLPGFRQWGFGSVVALIALRFLDGVCLGGEYSGANVLAMEESPVARRGIVGGIVQSGAGAAFVILSLLTLGVFQLFPTGGPTSAYAQWGWRIPFVIGAVLAFAFVLYYRSQVQESLVWEKSGTSKLSALWLLRGDALRASLQVFVLMTGLWLLLNSVTAVLPQVLARQSKLDSTHITWSLVVMYTVLTAAFIGGGALSQRMGRRRYLIVFGLIALAVGIPSYLALITITAGSFGAAVGWATLTCVIVVAPWAVVTSYLSERFQTANRSIGFGLGYSLAVILPSFYATYMQWLSGAMSARLAVLVIVGIGAVLVVIAAAVGPETTRIDFKAASTRGATASASTH